MRGPQEKQFSEPVTVFHERRLPEQARPAGYAALIDAYSLSVPLPLTLSAIGKRHRVFNQDGWRILTPRHEPHASLEGHLTFALKHEGLDLAVLKQLFLAVEPAAIEGLVRATPTGTYARRVWFLYEWLTGKTLNLPALDKGSYTLAVDPKLQWAIEGTNSPRHRVRNNLPGTPDSARSFFAPRSSRPSLPPTSRSAPVLSSPACRATCWRALPRSCCQGFQVRYVIEGEDPPQDRIQRWGRAIGKAGRQPLDLDELLRLQRIVIGDARFVRLGLRDEGGFVGEHDRDTGAPLPDHISARPQDLPSLANGMIALDRTITPGMDAVIAAAGLPSDSSTSTPSQMATAAFTATSSNTFLPGGVSIRLASCSRFRQRSWSGSKNTGACSRATPTVSCPLCRGSPRTAAV